MQHPDVVSANLQKEVNLGWVAGPYPAPPLANFQCHPVGVIPKNTHLTGELSITSPTHRAMVQMTTLLRIPIL